MSKDEYEEIIVRLSHELDWALNNMHEAGPVLNAALNHRMAETASMIEKAEIYVPRAPQTPQILSHHWRATHDNPDPSP